MIFALRSPLVSVTIDAAPPRNETADFIEAVSAHLADMMEIISRIEQPWRTGSLSARYASRAISPETKHLMIEVDALNRLQASAGIMSLPNTRTTAAAFRAMAVSIENELISFGFMNTEERIAWPEEA